PLVRAVLEGDAEGARRLLGPARGGEHLAASRGAHPDVAQNDVTQNDVAQIDVARAERERPGLVAEAAGLGHWDIVRELVEAGFHPDGGSGWAGRRPTALHFAAREGSEDLVRFVLARGADPTVVEPDFGASPAGWAEYFGHPSIAALLRVHARCARVARGHRPAAGARSLSPGHVRSPPCCECTCVGLESRAVT